MQATASLAAMHEAGLIHGDVKDLNVLVNVEPKSGEATAAVSDFGATQPEPEGADSIPCRYVQQFAPGFLAEQAQVSVITCTLSCSCFGEMLWVLSDGQQQSLACCAETLAQFAAPACARTTACAHLNSLLLGCPRSVKTFSPIGFNASQRCDVWALGMAMFPLLVGPQPFENMMAARDEWFSVFEFLQWASAQAAERLHWEGLKTPTAEGSSLFDEGELLTA
jgi:serine/threonine protein kinase